MILLKVKVPRISQHYVITSFTVKIEDLAELDEQDPEVVPGLFQGGFIEFLN